jgi:hypothetical protein
MNKQDFADYIACLSRSDIDSELGTIATMHSSNSGRSSSMAKELSSIPIAGFTSRHPKRSLCTK